MPPGREGRPEAGSEIHIVLALGPAGQIFGSELHIVRSILGSNFQQNAFIFARFYNGNGSEIGVKTAALGPGRTSTSAQAWPAHRLGNIINIFLR